MKSFKTRENILFQNLMHFAMISANLAKRRQIVGVDLFKIVCVVEGMKIYFTYKCPNHSEVSVIDKFDFFKYD